MPQNAKFDGMMFSATGSPYAMQRRDAEVYGKPYVDDPAASVALATTMDKVRCGVMRCNTHACMHRAAWWGSAARTAGVGAEMHTQTHHWT